MTYGRLYNIIVYAGFCVFLTMFIFSLMRQVPAMRASEQLEAAWDREVGVPPGVRTDSKMGCSSHTGLATQKQRVGAHARAPLRSAV